MVVRSIVPTLNEALGASVIAHNCSIFRGEGTLGEDFSKALRASCAYAGVHYVETLVNTSTGSIDEILLPDSKRVYEKEVTDQFGNRSIVPVSLSNRLPSHRLAVFIVDARGSNEILDVIARDEISPHGRACLRHSLNEMRSHSAGGSSLQSKAA